MSHRKVKKTTRSIVSIILSFLLAVIFTAGSILVGVYIGFLNENRIIDGLNYKDYYSGVENKFYEKITDISTPMGIPESVVSGIVESETIHQDVKNYVVAAVNGQTFVISTDTLKANLETNVRTYFISLGWELSAEQEATLPEYTQIVADEYVSLVKVPFVEHFAQAKDMLRKIILIALPIIAVLTGLCVFLLLKMQRWKHRGVRYVTYSTFSAMVMVALPGIAALISGFYEKINISSEYLYNALVKFISNGLWVFIYLAIVWLVISVSLLFIIRFLKQHKN